MGRRISSRVTRVYEYDPVERLEFVLLRLEEGGLRRYSSVVTVLCLCIIS